MDNAEKRAEARNKVGAYRATIGSIEPSITQIDSDTFHASTAISLKRIADLLEKLLEQNQGG